MSGVPLLVNPQPKPTGPETFEEKAKRKFKEQPLVPIGLEVMQCLVHFGHEEECHCTYLEVFIDSRISLYDIYEPMQEAYTQL